MAGQYNNNPIGASILVHALVWLSISIAIVGCGDTQKTNRVPAPPQLDGGTVTDDDPQDTTGGTVGQDPPNTALPMQLQLQTLEEQPVVGTFSLIGELTGAVFPAQTYSILTDPMHGIVSTADQSRRFTYTPDENFFGIDTFAYSIASGLSAVVTIDVANINDAPILFADVQRVIEQDIAYTAALIASDPDNDPLKYSASNLPSWLSLDSRTGVLSGVPLDDDVGLYEDISFSVIDAEGLIVEVSDIRIEVIEKNDAPSINPDQFPSILDAGEAIAVNLFPDDPDGDPVNLAFEPNEYLDVNVVGGTVEVVAAEVSAVTEVNLVLLATDIRGGVSRTVVPITVFPMNASGRGRTVFGRSGSGAGVHLVVLGDGYREEQQITFREHVNKLIQKMQSDVGMQTHIAAWNIHMVETPSIDSGIDDNVALDQRDTVYGTGYFCQGVRRLICGNRSKIYGVAIDEYPNFDQILVLVNDSRYGGSGGNIAISSTESIEIALHEMGHSIAGLADEYTDQYIPDSVIPAFVEGRYANVSANSDSSLVPWTHWLTGDDALPANNGIPSVGVFQGAYYRDNGFYRPTQDSLMRSYDGALGPVNSEQWALSVYSRSNPVLEISPVSRVLGATPGEVLDFSVLPMFDSSVQSVQWQLDSRVIPGSSSERPSISLSFPAGRYEVAVIVRDISGLIRKPEPHAGVFQWSWIVVVE